MCVHTQCEWLSLISQQSQVDQSQLISTLFCFFLITLSSLNCQLGVAHRYLPCSNSPSVWFQSNPHLTCITAHPFDLSSVIHANLIYYWILNATMFMILFQIDVVSCLWALVENDPYMTAALKIPYMRIIQRLALWHKLFKISVHQAKEKQNPFDTKIYPYIKTNIICSQYWKLPS